MSINSSFFMSDFNFDVTVKSLLLGFSRKENVNETGCNNVVIFGTTESSAQAYVSNILKGTIPSNIVCAGVDTNPAHLRGKGFSGYVVMLPELRFVAHEHYDKITDVFEVLATSNLGKMGTGEYKDLEIFFARRDIEARFFGSLFEKWKTGQENRGWHFYGEHCEFSRSRKNLEGRPDKAPTEYLGFGDEADYKKNPTALRMAPPIVLSWTKVVDCLFGKGNTHVTEQTMHPVRFGPAFSALSPNMLRRAIEKFNQQDLGPGVGGRTVCIHDSLALILFEDRIRPSLAIGSQYDCCEAGDADDDSPSAMVTLEEVSI